MVQLLKFIENSTITSICEYEIFQANVLGWFSLTRNTKNWITIDLNKMDRYFTWYKLLLQYIYSWQDTIACVVFHSWKFNQWSQNWWKRPVAISGF